MTQNLVFGVMTDCQYADADNSSSIVPGTHHENNNYYRLAPGKLQQAVDVFNDHELDFVVHLGDFVDRKLDDFEVVDDIAQQLRAPLVHVLGNHDFAGSEGRADTVLQKFNLQKSYYSQTVKGYRLIVLDTNELGVIKYAEGSEEWKRGRAAVDDLASRGVLQAYDWNGGVGEVQLAWLASELQSAKDNGEKAILFSHHPVFPPGTLNALDDTAIVALIEQYQDTVIAYINGHNHVGAYGYKNTIPYITVPGMLQSEANAFGIVSVSDDQLVVDGYDRMQDMTIALG